MQLDPLNKAGLKPNINRLSELESNTRIVQEDDLVLTGGLWNRLILTLSFYSWFTAS